MPVIKPVNIVQSGGSEGTVSANSSGSHLGVYSSGSSTGEPNRQFAAQKVWNAVWNDFADFQLLCDRLEYGKCYIDTPDGAMLATQRCQMSVIGLASDTFGHAAGARNDVVQVPIAVAGWALAYVDREYPCGTPLTNDENGNLTEMTLQEKRDFPERLVAIYKRKELEEEFGPKDCKIKVNGRHWVKVKS